MAAHGLVDVTGGGAGGELLERGVERHQAEHVTVRAVATRRARPPPAALTEVVSSLERRALALGEPPCLGLDPPREPNA
jgi:hypothetical protein